jgi:lipopolysaccharide/colanic/teichoic acid biosynthesis glycosyltransferase
MLPESASVLAAPPSLATRAAMYKLLHYVRMRATEARDGHTYRAGLYMPASRLDALLFDLALIYDALLEAHSGEARILLEAACRTTVRACAESWPLLTVAELAERAVATHRRYLQTGVSLASLSAAVEMMMLRPAFHANQLSSEQRRLRHDLTLVLSLEAQVVRSSALVALGASLALTSLVDDREQHLYLFCDRYGCFNGAEIGEEPVPASEGLETFALPNDAAKRGLDFFASFILLLAAFPLLLTLYCLIKHDPGPALYNQKRVGRNGRIFKCWKFRTMVPNAEQLLEEILQKSPQAQEEYLKYAKLRSDPRITPIGRFLRKTSLDELPQLFNVLIGDMSLVGPRPIAVEERDRWGVHFRDYKRLRPGLTGPWQLYFRSNHPYDEQFQHVRRYAQQWSVLSDLRYLAETLAVPFRQRGAY